MTKCSPVNNNRIIIKATAGKPPVALLLFKLIVNILGIEWRALQQFLVGAGARHRPVLDKVNLVSIDNRTQPVGNHQGGPPLHQVAKGFLNHCLGFSIQAGRGLVEH